MGDGLVHDEATHQVAEPRLDAVPVHHADEAQHVRRPVVQTKLRVGAAGDSFEREADNVAAKVVRALQSEPGPAWESGDEEPGRIRRSSGSQAATTQPVESAARVQRIQRAAGTQAVSGRPVESATRIQRSGRIGAAGGDIDEGTERILRSSLGGGRPMSDEARSKMEPAFGADFSGIRLHSGSRATELNDRIQAKAFTTGSDIFFRDGVPDTSTTSGQSLLAHELTHTVQQGAAGVQRQADEVVSSVAPRIQRNGGESVGLLAGPSDQASGDSESGGWDGLSTTIVYAKSKKVTRGTRNLYTSKGKHAGNIAKGAMLDIEVPHYEVGGVLGVHAPPPTSTVNGNKQLVKVCSFSKNITFVPGADRNDIWISYGGIEIQDEAKFGYLAPAKADDDDGEEEEEEEGGEEAGEEAGEDDAGAEEEPITLSVDDGTATHNASGAVLSQNNLVVPLGAGNKLTLAPKEQSVEGAFDKELSYKTGVHPSFDMPIPAPFPAYVTVGLDADLKLGLKAEGKYKVLNNGEKQTFDINGDVSGAITGSLGVHAGVGVGVANIAGVEANLLATTTANFETDGKLEGKFVRQKDNEFHSSSLKLHLESEASLKAKVAGQLKAKLVGMSREKTITLKEFTFAEFDYERDLAIEMVGLSKGSVIPRLSDFKKAYRDDEGSLYEEDDEREQLLGDRSKKRQDALKGVNMYATELKKFNDIMTGALASGENATISRTEPRLLVLREKAKEAYATFLVSLGSSHNFPVALDAPYFEADLMAADASKNEKKFLLHLYTNYNPHGR